MTRIEGKGQLYVPEIEQQVLGNILNSNEKAYALGGVRKEWFFEPAHAEIMDVIQDRLAMGVEANFHTVSSRLADSPLLADLGGQEYLAKMTGFAMFSGFDGMALELRNLWARRIVADALREGLGEIETFSQFQSPQPVLSGVENAISAVASLAADKPLVETALRGMTGALSSAITAKEGDGVAGIKSGIADLDALVGGFAPGDMIVLAGRPSMGKTAIALAMAWKMARQGHGVFFGSLEMPKEQLWNRFFAAMLADRGRDVPYFDIRTGRIDDDTLDRVSDVAKRFQDLPFLTGEKECRSLSRLRSAARRSKAIFEQRGTPLGAIFIDYLQLIEVPEARSDYARVSAASNAIKALAMDLGVPVIALSQLNRGVEQREPPEPRLSDLRESGKVEEDADTVMLVYRAGYYISKMLEGEDLSQDARLELEAQLLDHEDRCSLFVPKARGGPTGKVRIGYRPATNRVWDLPYAN